jgi:hypothetical protein
MDGTSIDTLRQQQRRAQVNMKLLAKDIENSLVNNNKKNTSVQPRRQQFKQKNNDSYEGFQNDLDLDDPDDLNDQEPIIMEKRKKPFNLKKFIREPLLLLVIYLIFSVDGVQDAIAKKIPQIQPSTSSGHISYLGKLIYGLILVITFICARYVVNLRD